MTGSNDPAPAVVIAGADEISRAHLERLAAACERRGVPLTLLFRHLRDTGLSMLGGGAAAFMRLGHHGEAEQAAAYIGRQHRFVLSNVTASLGGSDTQTITETEGQTVTDTIHIGGRAGWRRHVPRRGPGNPDGEESRRRSRSRSVARNWSTARSWAESTNWSNAAASQRVYEYAVSHCAAEPARPGAAAGHQGFRPPGAEVRGMRPGYRHPAPGQCHPAARPGRRAGGWAGQRPPARRCRPCAPVWLTPIRE